MSSPLPRATPRTAPASSTGPRGVRAGAPLLLALLLGGPARALGAQLPAPAATLVRGTVRDAAQAPRAGVRVTMADVAGRESRAVTDAAGAFALTPAGPGRHVLQFRALGYRAATREVDVRAGRTADVAVTLEASAALAPVVVVGVGGPRGSGGDASTDVLTSVSVLAGAQVARENVQFAQEVLRKVPGVYHASFNQGIVSGDVGIRGFNAETDVASTKLLVDGIPTNLNSGLGEFNALFPLEIDRVTVVRGTNDPRFGLFNLAGNVSVGTRRGGSYVATRALAGSFDTQEAQGVVAREHALGAGGRGGALSQTWFAGARRGAGYRANSALDKLAGSAKLFYTTAGGRVTAGAIARRQALDTDAPGYLTRAESRADPRGSPAFSDADGGSVDTRQLSAHVEVRHTPSLAYTVRAYDQRFERVRFVRLSAAGAQQERVEDERQAGALATATWRPAALAAADVAIAAGADWQHQDNVQQRFRTAARAREATLRDYAFTYDNGGGYARVGATLGRRLAVDAGLRVDRVGGEFRNLQAGDTVPALDFGWIPQPKASATLALGRRLSVYGNYGRGFQTGTGVAAYGRQPLTWSKNDGYEAGVVLEPVAALSLRAGAWRQDATDEVRLRFDNSGDSENVGRTRRTGVDVEGSARLVRTLSLWGALTTQRATLVEPGAADAATRGKRLNHVPGWTAKYGADWAPAPRVSASFWAYGQGAYHLTDLNALPTFGAYTAVNADLAVRVGAGVGVGLAVQNAFDRYYEYVWYDGAQTLHSPANARSVFLTVTFDR